MRTLRIGTPYWLDHNAPKGRRHPPLSGESSTDVVVIGGGVTGCACALLLAQAGARVTLLEASRIGRGSTAASTALLMHEPDADFLDLADRYGAVAAADIWRAGQRAKRDLLAALQNLQPASRVDRTPSIYFSRSAHTERDLRRELDARHEAGLSGRWLSSRALHERTGITGVAAIETTGNAALDPYRSCLALAAAAAANGAQLHERSRVTRVRVVRDGVVVSTGRGKVHADRVVVATGYATPEFKPLAGRFRMLNTYVIATPVLPRRLRVEIGLGDVMLWDTERPYHYARWTADRRLIFGGRDRPHRRDASRRTLIARTSRALAADLESLYPALRGVTPAYAWEGLFATTPDGLPYVGAHRRYPRHLFALGYGGNGMTFAFLAAQILVRAINGTPRAGDALFAFNRLEKR